jgi:hypothetical protein
MKRLAGSMSYVGDSRSSTREIPYATQTLTVLNV